MKAQEDKMPWKQIFIRILEARMIKAMSNALRWRMKINQWTGQDQVHWKLFKSIFNRRKKSCK